MQITTENIHRKETRIKSSCNTVHVMARTVRACITVLSLAVVVQAPIHADSLIPPADPKQSITYWKQYTLPADDPQVQRAQQVFSVLLRAWDQSRIEPDLYVVESDAGAWAASLSDGNILLSRAAIDSSFSFGKKRGEHLLAFVLAHELAHQRVDDLWHQRFFRMLDTQSAQSQETMLHGLTLGEDEISQLQKKEAQADHDGLVLMSSVGYDPYQVTGNKDFFTLWVENIWQQNCSSVTSGSGQSGSALGEACEQAKARALRAETQLENVTARSTLYELGIQAFVAGHYARAREYFTIYGRDYPGRTILTAIGATHLAEAQALLRERRKFVDDGKIDFYYPVILDATLDTAYTGVDHRLKRSTIESKVQQLDEQAATHLSQAARNFEKAIKLAPDYKKTYLLLASTHLLANNTYLARGVLQGRYMPRFQQKEELPDPAIAMLLSLTTALEGDASTALKQLDKLSIDNLSTTAHSVLSPSVLLYSLSYNRAELHRFKGDEDSAKQVWLTLASHARSQGDTLLFRMALAQVENRQRPDRKVQVSIAPMIEGMRPGSKVASSGKMNADAATGRTGSKERAASVLHVSELWVDGERYQTYSDANTHYVTDDQDTVISVWQNDTLDGTILDEKPLHLGDSADRPFKILGIPDRELDLTSGKYFAYDDLGLAIRLADDSVKGWFLYEAQ